MSKITKHKTLAKAQNKNPHKSLMYNIKKRMKEGNTVHLKTYSKEQPVVPVEVVLFAQGSTFVVKTPTNEDHPEGFYTFANDGEKFWTPYNFNYIQSWLDGLSYPFQYKDMVVRLVNSETRETLTTPVECVRVRQPGENLGSHHPIIFGLKNGKSITSKVWHQDTDKVVEWKKQDGFKGNLNHVKLVFKAGGKEFDNCFIYFKLGTSQFDLSQPKGVFWNRVYSTFGL